jgi:starch phosphorylase
VSRASNGVSELHGEVSRQLFSGLEEGRAIGHVTNGVHARTWTSQPMQELFDQKLGEGWDVGSAEAWKMADQIEDSRISDERDSASEHLSEQLGRLGHLVDPDALIVGWARRFAPYKRPTLILRDRPRLVDLLSDDDRPIHFVFGGKPHPEHVEGHQLLSEIVAFASSPEANGRFSFVSDYDMELASHLTRGCDVWLNNPVRLHEASGTSGEKAALNGVLNLSVLDGWWAEMFDGENGWAIDSSESEDISVRDDHEVESVVDLLVSARDEYFGDRVRFNARIRHAWRTLGPKVTAARMLRDYQERVYRL